MAAAYDKFKAGDAIRKGREALDLTQTQLADKVDISVSHLKQIETGYRNASITTLIALFDELSISADSVFGIIIGRNSIDLKLMSMPEKQREYFLEVFQTMIAAYPAA